MLHRTVARLGAVATPSTRRYRDVVVRGHPMHVVEVGPEDGEALLCIPGRLGTAEGDFEHQLAGLSEAGHRVVSFDPRGYGKSRPGRREFPVNFHDIDAEDAASVMHDVIGVSAFNLLGWDDGANASVLLASKYPKAVQRLVIFGGFHRVTAQDVIASEMTRSVQNWSPSRKAKYNLKYGRDLQPMWDELCDALALIHKRGGDVCMWEAKSLQCPTLVLHGALDLMSSQDEAQWFTENIPGAAEYYFKEGRHNFHQVFHLQFNALADHFLSTPLDVPDNDEDSSLDTPARA